MVEPNMNNFSRLHKVIVKAWVEKDGKYLLAQRGATEKHHAGIWSLPGGNVEHKVEESILEETLKKEVKEEVGVEVKDKMELVYNNAFIKTSDGSHVINLTFLCHWKSGEAKPLEDTTRIRWFTLEELQNFENPPDFLEREIKHLASHLKK